MKIKDHQEEKTHLKSRKHIVNKDDNISEVNNTSSSSSTVLQNSASSSQQQQQQNKYWSFIKSYSFIFILFVRSISACYNLIWDCDETYNYWEPLHYIMYNSGFQTWEYSPVYSLRSYFYIYIHALPLLPFKYVLSKITLFYLLRFIFAIVSSKLESDLFQTLSTLSNGKYAQIANYYFFFTITNAGMFLSSTSFLPSTFSMYLTCLAYTSWLQNGQSRAAILAIGTAVILGWPFAVLVGVPIAISICLFMNGKKSFIFFLTWTLLFAILIGGPVIAFDSFMFGKLVFASLNIVLYNVFPSDPNMGPDLYGREPVSYYLLNCLLNFNILSFIVCLTPILLFIDYIRIKQQHEKIQKYSYMVNKAFSFVCLAVCLWILVFFTRPHKEERFLYPIYPLVLILASVSLNYVNTYLKKYKLFRFIPYLIILMHALLSLMRILALIKNYSASIQVYHELNKPNIKHSKSNLETKELINVCVSKEWYRYPSSFFMPETINLNVRQQKWRLRFLPSDFKGQLPGYFNESITVPYSTRHVDTLFNDLNKEVFQRYIDIKKCDFLIDTDNKVDDSSVHLYLNKKNTNTKWKTLIKLPFLDASSSNKFLRSFYIPYLYEARIKLTFFKLRLRV